jgi:alpha-L-fucosidase
MRTMETQLRELITRYNPDILWFDGDWPTWWNDERGRQLEEFVRNLKPSIIINNRLGNRLHNLADYNTPEQAIPAGASPNRLWETAMTLNNTWGYKDTDNAWKSPATVVRNIADIASKGGNFLLNVGPTGLGVIPAASVQILSQVGAWLNANAQAVYGTSIAPVTTQNWGSLTRRGNSIYAIVLSRPSSGVLHVPIVGAVTAANLLNGTALRFASGAGGVDVTLPVGIPSGLGTVIRIDYSGAIRAA